MLVSYDILPNDAVVFIFQADRTLLTEESRAIEEQLHTFIAGWTSHNLPVNGSGKIWYNRFIVIFADESADKLGGCSKDKVNQFIRDTGEKFHINFFDRLQVAYLDDADIVSSIPLSQLTEGYDSGKLSPDTVVFNNLVSTKITWETGWKQALSASPFSRFVIQKVD
jgi:hypothetical protein